MFQFQKLGVALGFLLPPVIVKLHDNLDETGYELSIMFYMVAGVCSVLLLLVIFGKNVDLILTRDH